jgi:hypothetical protein
MSGFGKHGQIGANIFILMLAVGTIIPITRIFSASGFGFGLAATAALIIGAWANARSIIRCGSGSYGEIFGLISGALVLMAAWLVGLIWALLDRDPAWVDGGRVSTVVAISILLASAWRRFGTVPGGSVANHHATGNDRQSS